MSAEPANWEVRELASDHIRDQFSCGHDTLDAFIKQLASQHQKKGISKTFVAIRPPDPTVRGYYSLASGSVHLDCLTHEQRKGLPRHPIPVALLGRLAVDKASQGQRLGEFLLIDSMRRVVEVATEIGIHAIEVDAIDDAARRFYLKYGFTELADDPRHLYIPVATVRKLGLA